MSEPPEPGNPGPELSHAALLGRLLALAWQYRSRCIAVFAYQVLLLALGVLGLSLAGLAIDVTRHAIEPASAAPRWPLGMQPPSWSTLELLAGLAGLVLVAAATRGLLNYFYAVAAGDLLQMKLVPELRTRVFDKLQRLSFRFFDQNASGSIFNRVTGDVQSVRSFVDGVLLQGAIMLLSLCAYLAYMLRTHVGLTGACLALTPLLWLATNVFARWAAPVYRKNRELSDRMVLAMSEGVSGVQVTKVFGREQAELERFEAHNGLVRDQQRAIFVKVSRFGPTIDFISQLNIGVLLLYGGSLVAQSRMSLGDLIVFAGLLQQFSAQVSSMAGIVNTLQQSLSGARRVFEVLDAPLEVDDPLRPREPEQLLGRLRFENVGFGYYANRPVLSELSFEIEPGSCVAVLGATGAGKSTLLSLIPRFYDPTAGRILLDGVDLKELDLDYLRRNIGLVFQESLLFKNSVAQNIAFGSPSASREQIEHAAKIAGAHQFVTQLPDGYDTVLEEGAVNLSGGQRQRLAIARALLLQPKILLLDDPTTAVDTQTEHEVLQAMDAAIEGRTTLIIANRLSTLRRADWILVLDEGRIVERGTHAELMKNRGIYYRAASLQAADEGSIVLLEALGEARMSAGKLSIAPEPDQKPLDFGIVRRLFRYTRPYARLRNGLFGLVVLRSIQLPLITWATATLISGPIARHDAQGTALGVVGYLALTGFTSYCFVYRQRLALLLGEAVVHDLRFQVYQHLLCLPMSFFKKVQVGKLIGRITSDVDVVRTGVQDVAFVSTVQLGSMLISASLMLYYDWKLFLVVLVMAPVLWLLVKHFRRKLSAAYRAQAESFSRVAATLAESVSGIREIQGFVRQDLNGGLFQQLIYDHSRYNMVSAQQSAMFLPMLEFNGQLFLSILLIAGGYQVLGGQVQLEALIQFLFLSTSFFGCIPSLGNQYNQALTAMAGAERVFGLLDTAPEWSDAPDARDLPPLAGRVEFRKVSFAYEADRQVLHDLDFVAEPGKTVALVGMTGSGKSSIVNLVAKLYLAKSGQILIDGHEIQSVTSVSLHRQIASVTQDNFLFAGSVLENIRLGRPGASDADVEAAARALDIVDVIEDLPQGFHSEVGEKGAGLSLGQRQVVCFVRAMLADPRILILDEATSSVDTVTESRLQHALMKLLQGRTSFVVAHRLSTIRHADLVLVLDQGRIVESGNHRQLLALGGRYARMYQQFVSSTDLGVAPKHGSTMR